MTRLRLASTTSFLLLLLASACASSAGPGMPGETGGGKADGADARALRSVEILDYHSDGGEEEHFDLFVEPTDAFLAHIEEGTRLSVSLYADDGASVMDYRVEGSLTQGVDGMMTDAPLDTSSLLPYRRLGAQFTTTTPSGFVVDETWIYDPATDTWSPAELADEPESVFRGLSLFAVEIGPESGSLGLVAELSDAEYGNAADGDRIKAELWADDVDWNVVTTALTYEADGIGGFAASTIDVSALLPYHDLFVRLSGTLGSERRFSETWLLTVDDVPVLVGVAATFSTVSFAQVGDGVTSEQLMINASLSDGWRAVDGETVEIEIWQPEGDDGAHVRGTLTYVEEGYQSFTTNELIDVSELVGWDTLRMRIRGLLRSGAPIDETFDLDTSGAVTIALD